MHPRRMRPRATATGDCIRSTILVEAFLVSAAACSAGGSDTGLDAAPLTSTAATSSSAATSTPAGLRLVALGDSDAGTQGDSEGKGWVERYAKLLEARTGETVHVTNRALDGQPSDALLTSMQQDETLRADIAAADIVVLGAGGSDLNTGDALWEAGSCAGTSCYSDGLEDYAKNISSAMALVADLRGGRPTLLRAMTLPNALTGAESAIQPFLRRASTAVGVFYARSLRTSTCAALRAVGGECIDVLTRFNGRKGTQNAYAPGLMNLGDCCYPSAKGHQVIADLLMQTGTEPRVLK